MIRAIAGTLVALFISIGAYRYAPALPILGTSAQAHRIPPLSFVDDRNRPTRLDAPAHGALIVLGYTRCSDECPLTLNNISIALNQFRHRDRPAAYFITVDPKVDDTSTLHRHLTRFANQIEGITGPRDDLHQLYFALDAGGTRDRLHHDTHVFGINARGEVAYELPATATARELEAALTDLSR